MTNYESCIFVKSIVLYMIISCVLLNIFDAQRIWGVPFYLSIIFFSENASEKIVTKESTRHIRIKLWDMELLKPHLWISRAKRFEYTIFHRRLLAERLAVTECQEYNWQKHKVSVNARNYFGLYVCNKNLVLFTSPEFLNRSFIRKIICLPSDYTQKYKE